MWPSLQDARDNIKEIENEIDKMLKNHNSLSKKELSQQKELLLAEFAESLAAINEQINELKTNLEKHRKYLEAKSNFIQRHYKRV